MGFPDNYTNIPGAKDGNRYKALGNSMAVPVIKWLGTRIDLVCKAHSLRQTPIRQNEEALPRIVQGSDAPSRARAGKETHAG